MRNSYKTKNQIKAKEENVYGWELIIDLYQCDLKTISDGQKIANFAKELCKTIDMKPFGEPQVYYFGKKVEYTKGHSLLQFIETSSITGHFSESKKSAYINIFSCKPYDAELVETFTKEFFGAEYIRTHFIVRD